MHRVGRPGAGSAGAAARAGAGVMGFGQSGWFTALLEQEMAQHQPLEDARAPGISPRARARAHVRMVLQDSGLLYGTPEQVEHPAGLTREEQLSLAVLRTLVRLALDLADISGPRPRAPRRAASPSSSPSGADTSASRRRCRRPCAAPATLPRRSVARLETLLEDRAMSLGADPLYGLLLHNGAAYVDAQLFAHLALAAWLHTRLGLEHARRRLAVAARQKALLVEVLTALACAERPPTPAARQAILRQVDSLGLPKPVGPMLRARVKEVFRERPDLDVLVRPVRSLPLRRFILQQTLLASLVEGRRSPAELRLPPRAGPGAAHRRPRASGRSRARWRSSTPRTARCSTCSPCARTRPPWARSG